MPAGIANSGSAGRSLTDLWIQTELGGKCTELEPKGLDGSVWWHNPLGTMARTV